MLWERRWLVIGAVLVAVSASLIFSMAQETVYKAEALVNINPQGGVSSGQDAETFVNQVFQEVDTQELRSAAIQQSGWRGGEDRFERQRTVQAFAQQDGEESGLLVQFSSSDSEEAASAANTYANLFVERVTQLNERLAGGSIAATASVQSRAATPERPSSPRPLLYALVAVGAGFLAGGILALTLESRTQSWRGARDAELTLRAPVLGTIPEHSSEEGGLD